MDEGEENGAGDELVAMLDWQVVHPDGLVTTDLARLFATSAADGVLAAHKDELLQLYHETLVEALGGAVRGAVNAEDDGEDGDWIQAPFDLDAVKGAWALSLEAGTAYAIVGAAFFIPNGVLDGPRFEIR